MFKHTIKYDDFNGNERVEDFYFHLSTPEVVRLEAKFGATIEEYTKAITEQQDLGQMIDFLESIILSSYGRKTTDGKSFIKNKELRTEFEYSQAYAELFEEILLNKDLAVKFGEGVAETSRSKRKKNTVEPKIVGSDSE